MDNLKTNFKLLETVISNVIRREIDCFTDEVYKAKKVYLMADSEITDYIKPFTDRLNAERLSSLDSPGEVPKESLLICITDKRLSEEMSGLVHRFNKKGRTIVITTDYEQSEMLYSRETIGISLPSTVSSDRQQTMLFRQAVTFILDEVLLKLDSKGSSRLVSQ